MADLRGRKSGNLKRPARTDVRAARTDRAVLGAFRDLVLEQSYTEVSFDAVARRAGVGRSTLYEHFSGKHDLLASSIAGPFGCLAATLDEQSRIEDLTRMLEHFWENRALARSLFSSSQRRRLESVLLRLVLERLKARGLDRSGALVMPPRLAAASLSQLLLAPLLLWLDGESDLPAAEFARALNRTARSALTAMRDDQINRGTP